MAMDELAFIEWLRNCVGGAESPHGIGDDMAVVDVSGERVLFSSDMLLDGRHFDTTRHAYDAIGRKAINCCLSDCAAMAVKPVAVTVSVALQDTMTDAQTKSLFEGMLAATNAFDVKLVGGDTTRWSSPLAVDVNVLATPFPNIDPVTRSGAKVGDAIFVTGPLGGSGLDRHLDFTPRITEARAIAEALGNDLHAMIDISDGLSLDLWRVCQASGVGATLNESALVSLISDDAQALAERDGTSPIEHVLGDGEDFELLLVTTGNGTTFRKVLELDAPPVFIGTIVEAGLNLATSDRRTIALEPKGFVH